jgi:outer membrane protein assembly factor BamB
MSSRSTLAIIATVALLLAGAPNPSSGAEDGDGGTVAVLFDFGDGRWAWNDTTYTVPTNAWCATVNASQALEFDLEHSFSQYGVFLESVDGVSTPADFSKYWGLWWWNDTKEAWQSSLVGALDLNVTDMTAIAWRFGAFGDPSPAPDPLTREPWAEFRGGRDVQGTWGSYGPYAGGLFWSVDMDNGPIDGTLAVANGKVFGVTAGIFDWNDFVFTQLPTVFALNVSSGELVWEYEFRGSGGFEIGSPAYGGGAVYVTTSSRQVLALDASDGTLKWSTTVDDLGLSSSPTLAAGRVLVGTGSGKLVALWASSGAVNWTADISGGVYLAAPTVHDGVVYIGTDNGSLHAVNIEDGTEVWSKELGGRLRGTPLVVGDRIYAISAIYPGFVATEGYLHALDMNGDETWNVSIGPTGSSPAFVDGKVLVGSQSGMWAVTLDGTVAWRYQEAGQISSSPAVHSYKFFVLSNENDSGRDLHTSVLALGWDGDLMWERVLEPHNWALSSISVADHRLYTATDSGWVYCMGDTPYVPSFSYEVDGLKVTLSDDSIAVGRNITHHEWDIEGVDETFFGPTITYEFDEPGEYRVDYTTGDEFGLWITTEMVVEVEGTGWDLFIGGANMLVILVVFAVAVVLVVVLYARRR